MPKLERIASMPATPASTSTAKDDLLTIRDMCDAFDVTPRTLRFYEAKELLSPIRRGTGRFFTYRDRARLKLILRGKRFGFSLEDIRQLLDMYDRDGRQQEAQLRRTYELAQARLDQMERQRAELDEAIAELKDQMAWGAGVLDGFRKAAE
jgi:DNA-binding transcriptional MerR regulator